MADPGGVSKDEALAALAEAVASREEQKLHAAVAQAQAAGLSIIRMRPARKVLAELEAKKREEEEERRRQEEAEAAAALAAPEEEEEEYREQTTEASASQGFYASRSRSRRDEEEEWNDAMAEPRQGYYASQQASWYGEEEWEERQPQARQGYYASLSQASRGSQRDEEEECQPRTGFYASREAAAGDRRQGGYYAARQGAEAEELEEGDGACEEGPPPEAEAAEAEAAAEPVVEEGKASRKGAAPAPPPEPPSEPPASKEEAQANLAEAVAARHKEWLQSAIEAAQGLGVSLVKLRPAKKVLAELEAEAEAQKGQGAALEALAAAMEAREEEALQAGLEAAQAAGVSVVRLRPARKVLAELEAQKKEVKKPISTNRSSGSGKAWNYGGRSNNAPVNDRFREHEVALQERRMRAYAGRGQFRTSVEDDGDEKAQKYIDVEKRTKQSSDG